VNFNTQKEKQMKKKMKRMQMGGMAMPTRGTMPNERGAMPVRGGGGVPLQGPGGVIVKPPRTETKPRPVSPGPILGGGKGSEYPGMQKMMERPSIGGKSMRELRAGVGPFSLMDRVKAARGMKGGGLARKGVGMALAKGGLVKANGCAQRGKTKGRMM
jgi:hypothetical protein